MPRDGSQIYHLPPGTEGIPDTTIESDKYNAFVHDVEIDLNTPRPIIAGGTGANSADGSLAALGAEKASQQVTNYDSHAFVPGSFWSATTATNPPVADHAFSGTVYGNGTDIVLEARDLTDTAHLKYIRAKVGGTWGAWVVDIDTSSYVKKAGDTMTGHLVLPPGPADTNAVRKDYVDAGLAAVSAALATKAPIEDPIFTGNPQATTPATDDNDNTLATTAFVKAVMAAGIYTVIADGAVTFAKMAASAIATAAEYLNNTANKILTTDRVWAAAAPVGLGTASSFTPDFNSGLDFILIVNSAAGVLNNPTNRKPGQKGVLYLCQDSAGARAITTWGSHFKFPGGIKPTLTTTPNAVDVLAYVCVDANQVFCTFQADFK